MTSRETVSTPRHRNLWLIVGIVLAVLGAICAGIGFFVGLTGTEGIGEGALRATLLIVGAVLFGAGLVAIITGVLKKNRA
jgi:predicted Abi (CAAX) family protease